MLIAAINGSPNQDGNTALLLVQGMIIVGDGHRDYDCGHQGACAQRPSGDDVNARDRTRILARRIVEVAQATRELRHRG